MITTEVLMRGTLWVIAWTLVLILSLTLVGWLYSACFFSGLMLGEVLIFSCFFIDYLESFRKTKE